MHTHMRHCPATASGYNGDGTKRFKSGPAQTPVRDINDDELRHAAVVVQQEGVDVSNLAVAPLARLSPSSIRKALSTYSSSFMGSPIWAT